MILLAVVQASERVLGVSNPRKYNIARTETIGSLNGGRLLGFEESGVEMKEWLSAEDEVVRESHAELEGEKVPLNGTFGAQSASFEPPNLRFPGDPGGSPHEIINCRCTMLPVLE